ncbi:hypothetical protein [Pseudonocardia ailaonensis]|uniref:hypothetical protein n=1 Tax=Pseudonocardia ailaonensis TaxID=367279 RepID=UPI0031E0BC4C
MTCEVAENDRLAAEPAENAPYDGSITMTMRLATAVAPGAQDVNSSLLPPTAGMAQ